MSKTFRFETFFYKFCCTAMRISQKNVNLQINFWLPLTSTYGKLFIANKIIAEFKLQFQDHSLTQTMSQAESL
eukprot:747259-Hanusia_phi.AAC.3